MLKPKLGHFWLLFVYPVLGFFLFGNIVLRFWGVFWPWWKLSQNKEVVSPLLFSGNPTKVLATNLWLPDERQVFRANTQKPDIRAESYLVVDLATDQVLLEKDSRKRRPVASLVKIMTALVAQERGEPGQVITVSAKAASIGEASMGLSEGEKLTLEELLWGLLLVSGNDAAEAIAEGLAPTREIFINWLNSKVYELGLSDTYFVNASGLEEEGKIQYSTAYDLTVITYHALKNPLFRKIVGTREHFIPYTKEHKAFYLPSQTNLLGQYPGVAGVKVGYTDEAGLCGVTLAKRGGHEILGVVLNSPDRRKDLKELLDYSFNAVGINFEVDSAL